MTSDDDTNKTGGDIIGGDKVLGDKVMGDKLINIVQPLLPPALHQLRAPVSDFVGREQEIDQLVQALSKAATSGAAAAISGVRGMGGIGKTELAHVVAHRLKDAFPDAQLLVELRGASSNPLTPEQALQTVIRAFERAAKLPDDLGQLKGLYSSVLASKRALILADDARDVGQVRPLLPPAGCALLVTSRNRFSLPGMAVLDLGTLPKDDAEKLLLDICPRIWIFAEEQAKLCGYLPLALRISASLLKENPARDTARHLDQLKLERLKHLSDPDNPDDPGASVQASLRLTYEAMEPLARDFLCQLCVFASRFNRQAVAVVVETPGNVDELMELLLRHCLLEWEVETELYSLHDLVQIFGLARLKHSRPLYKRAKGWYSLLVHGVGDGDTFLHRLTPDELTRIFRRREMIRAHLNASSSKTNPRAASQNPPPAEKPDER